MLTCCMLQAMRVMTWSHNETWLVTADQTGVVKYWQANMNELKSFNAHDAWVRAVSFAPSDKKFVTASDDKTLKVWDFERIACERVLGEEEGGRGSYGFK